MSTGKANTTTYDRVVYHDVATPQNTWHTYSIDWTSERLQFLIDGSVIRTIPYADPLAVYGKNYPQTPMRVKLGNWAGGGPGQNKGTVEWAGGEVDFSKGPFNMYVREVSITNNNPACSYEYGDRSGSFESIKVITSGDSCSAEQGSNPSSSTPTGTMPGTETAASSTAPSKNSTVTVAPTESHSVAPIMQTVSLSTTVTGSSYSTNIASVSALNSANTDAPAPTATGSGSESTADTTDDAGSSTAPSSAVETSTGGAPSTKIFTAGSFLVVALGFFVL
jgi:hypothetical protein